MSNRFESLPGGPHAPPTTLSNGLEMSKEEEELEEKRQTRKECCKKAAKFTFSQLGLVLVVCLYAVAGGFIFQHLEKTNEKQECIQGEEKYTPMENDTMNKIWTIATNYRSPDDAEYALAAFHKQLAKFRDDVLALGYDGKNCSSMDDPDGVGYQWSFSGALLFSTTVFTTVGYGNIAPKTFWGRLVCIAYAVLGIPLMLLCLANIGEIMADVFRYVYINVCCFGFCAKQKYRPDRPQSGSTRRRSKSIDDWKNQYSQRGGGGERAPSVLDDEDDEEDDEEKMSVPLTVTMALIASYLFLGALLFGVWDDWDWLAAAYFCFITIATIGFGDIVPGGEAFNTVPGQLQMVGTAVYMVLGMAILSMAFNLIQEEIVTKFRWLGEKLGIVKKEDDDDDDMIRNQAVHLPTPELGTGNRMAGGMRIAAPPPGLYGSGLKSLNVPGQAYNPSVIAQTKQAKV